MSAVQVVWKTLWEKEKLLVTSYSFFSNCVFYLPGELSAIFIKFRIVGSIHFEFGRVLYLSFGKGLTNNTLAEGLDCGQPASNEMILFSDVMAHLFFLGLTNRMLM